VPTTVPKQAVLLNEKAWDCNLFRYEVLAYHDKKQAQPTQCRMDVALSYFLFIVKSASFRIEENKQRNLYYTANIQNIFRKNKTYQVRI